MPLMSFGSKDTISVEDFRALEEKVADRKTLEEKIETLEEELTEFKDVKKMLTILGMVGGGLTVIGLGVLAYEKLTGIKKKVQEEIKKEINKTPESDNIIIQKVEQDVKKVIEAHPLYKEIDAINTAKASPILVIGPTMQDKKLDSMLDDSGFTKVDFMSHDEILKNIGAVRDYKLVLINNRNGV